MDQQHRRCTIGQLLPLDDIKRFDAIDRKDLVAHPQTSRLGR